MELKKIPITRRLLSGGMNNRHRRREFMRFNCAVDKYNAKLKEKELASSKTVLNETNEESIIMESFPKLKDLKLFLR